MIKTSLALAAVALCTLATSTHAALMTFGAPMQIAGDTDVNALGTTVGAFNFGGGATAINGVNFQAFGLGAQVNTVGDFSLSVGSGTIGSGGSGFAAPPFSNLSASYQTLLGSGADRADTTLTLAMNNLTIGQNYLFQVWVNNSGDTFGFSVNVTDPTLGGDSVSLEPNTTLANGGLGEYVTATFTANAATQLVEFFGGEVLRVNGFQLRQVNVAAASVPEPGTALAGLIGLGLCATSRRRRK